MERIPGQIVCNNLPHLRVNKTKQHTHYPEAQGNIYIYIYKKWTRPEPDDPNALNVLGHMMADFTVYNGMTQSLGFLTRFAGKEEPPLLPKNRNPARAGWPKRLERPRSYDGRFLQFIMVWLRVWGSYEICWKGRSPSPSKKPHTSPGVAVGGVFEVRVFLMAHRDCASFQVTRRDHEPSQGVSIFQSLYAPWCWWRVANPHSTAAESKVKLYRSAYYKHSLCRSS